MLLWIEFLSNLPTSVRCPHSYSREGVKVDSVLQSLVSLQHKLLLFPFSRWIEKTQTVLSVKHCDTLDTVTRLRGQTKGYASDGLGAGAGAGQHQLSLKGRVWGQLYPGTDQLRPSLSNLLCMAHFSFANHFYCSLQTEQTAKRSQGGCTETSFAIFYSQKPPQV